MLSTLDACSRVIVVGLSVCVFVADLVPRGATIDNRGKLYERSKIFYNTFKSINFHCQQVQTSEKRTNHLFRMCPFFRGFTVIIMQGHSISGV